MTPILRFVAGTLFVFFLFVAPVRAEEVKAGDLVITQAWSRATPGGAKIAGGYLTIENKGSAPDRLIGGTGEVAGKIEVHEMSMKDGVMTMHFLDKGLAIEPGKTVKLAPGGYHLMMLDLKSPLKQGDKVPVTPVDPARMRCRSGHSGHGRRLAFHAAAARAGRGRRHAAGAPHPCRERDVPGIDFAGRHRCQQLRAATDGR